MKRLGIGGPVGSGKTALIEHLIKNLGKEFKIGVVTNDIYTREDAEYLIRKKVLPEGLVIGVETGGCPHAAVRDDTSMNLEAIEKLKKRFPDLDIIIVESGGDNLAASFSPQLADYTIYVIDVAGGDKIPRKGGPGITNSDLLIINKVDLAENVGASLKIMRRDSRRMRGEKPFLFTNCKTGEGIDKVTKELKKTLFIGER